MAISGKKISALEELTSIKGDEYIPVLSGSTNKKLGIGKLAKKEDIPDTSQLATKTELSAKLDAATYNSEKANFATKTELGDINTILDNINGEVI